MKRPPGRMRAVGKIVLEVLLIVVAVLLALGVNELREFIRSRQTERSYLSRLVVDAELNRQIAADFLNWHEQIVYHAWQVHPLIQTGSRGETDPMVLIAHAYLATAGPKPVWVDDTFEELKSTGNLSLIRNEEIRVRLLRYYRYLNFEDYPFQLTSEAYRESIRNQLDPKIQLSIRANCERDRPKCEINAGDFDAEEFVDWMSGNRALSNHLNRVVTQSTRAVDEFLTPVIVETDGILDILRQELGRPPVREAGPNIGTAGDAELGIVRSGR